MPDSQRPGGVQHPVGRVQCVPSLRGHVDVAMHAFQFAGSRTAQQRMAGRMGRAETAAFGLVRVGDQGSYRLVDLHACTVADRSRSMTADPALCTQRCVLGVLWITRLRRHDGRNRRIWSGTCGQPPSRRRHPAVDGIRSRLLRAIGPRRRPTASNRRTRFRAPRAAAQNETALDTIDLSDETRLPCVRTAAQAPDRAAGTACWAIQQCMATAAAAPALIERTEPNWEM